MPYVNSVPEKHKGFNNQNAARRWVAQPGARDAFVSGVDDRMIKVLPELARLACTMGLGTAFLIWTLLRFLDSAGSGYVERTFGLRALSKFGVGRKKLYRAVKAQERRNVRLFTIHPTKITYTSQTSLAAQLGATRAVQPRGIPELSFRSISSFYAHTFAAWISAVGDKSGGLMMSRDKLTKAWGISDTQQRTWEREAGILVQANVGKFTTPAQDDDSANAKRLIAALPRDRNLEARCWEHDGITYFQTVNRFVTPLAVSFRWGATRKAARAARHAIEAAKPIENVPTGRKQYQRVFFQQEWLRAQPHTMSATGSSLTEAGTAISTTRVRRNKGTGVLERYTTHFAVYDVCSLRPHRRGEPLL